MLNSMFWITCSLFVLVGCSGGNQQPEQATQERDPDKPQLQKIAISGASEADSLIAAGVEVIVVEPDYVVARVPAGELTSLTDSGLDVEPATEDDLIRRLIQVTVQNRDQITQMAEMGIDIWEVRNDTVKAQAFDNYIRQLREQGFAVTVLEDNIQNLVRKDQ